VGFGPMTVTAGTERHVFGFAPRRLADGTWKEGAIRTDGAADQWSRAHRCGRRPEWVRFVVPSRGRRERVRERPRDPRGAGRPGLRRQLTRRIRRRDWKRALAGDGADELLATRADKARTKLEQHDLLHDRS
jgi:hypothetical protein